MPLSKHPVSLEADVIKRSKHRQYKDIMQFARGGMAEKLKARLKGEPGRVAHAVDGRENDVDAADSQADEVQDGLDKAQLGRHGTPQMDEPAEHVGLGEKEEPLSMRELHKHLKAPADSGQGDIEHVGSDQLAKAGKSKSHSGLLEDLSDDEIKKLLAKRG